MHFSFSWHAVVADVEVLTDDWLRLDIDMGKNTLCTEGAPGTQWVYLRVPGVSGEWHPFSLAARGPSVIIKGVGDWSKSLHKLAVKTAAAAAGEQQHGEGARQQQQQQQQQLGCRLPVEIDGVYGHQAPAWQSYSHILLIGGGVGVTPWLPLMDLDSAGLAAHQRCSLIFVTRDEVEYAAMLPFLPAGKQRVKVR